MKKSTHEMRLSIPIGTHDLVTELGMNTPDQGFVPLTRVKETFDIPKHQLIYTIGRLYTKEPVYAEQDGEVLPVEVTLYDGWSGITRRFCDGTEPIKIKYSSSVLMPKYADKRLIAIEQEKSIWKIGILRKNHLNKLRSGTWSKDKFLSEADFLLSC